MDTIPDTPLRKLRRWGSKCNVGWLVVKDPSGWFTPGETYTPGELADWLEAGMLPEGLIVANLHHWRVCGDVMVKVDQEHQQMDAMGLRSYRYHGPIEPKPADTRIRVLRAIQLGLDENGVSPSHPEIANVLSITYQGVQYHLARLEADGLLVCEPGKEHGCWVTAPGTRLLEELGHEAGSER